MLRKLALLVAVLALVEGLAMASCTPGYAGSGYYRQRDCGLRLGARAYSSPRHTYGYGYGQGYGYGIDAVIPTLYGPTLYGPTLYGPPLSYGYPGGYPASLPHVPRRHAAPYLGQPHGGYGVVPGLRHSPRPSTRVRPQRRWSNVVPSSVLPGSVLPSTIRPGLRSGLGDLVGGRSRSKLARITRLSNGVWINP